MTKKTTITRRKSRNKDLTKSQSQTKKLQVILLYTNGKTYKEIADELGWTELSIKREIAKHFEALKVLISTENLIASQTLDDKGVTGSIQSKSLFTSQKKIDKDINEKFLSLLSSERDAVLSQEEIFFCYLLVHEGDELKALHDSGLASGLVKRNTSYKRAAKLRILMLKGKRNLIRYISNLQISYAKEMNLNKESIQSEIISQLRQLKEQNNPKNAPTIAKLTEQLGRTVGAFSDKIVIEEVNFDQAMDKMLEMRKANGTSESAKVEPETYIYDPEDIR